MQGFSPDTHLRSLTLPTLAALSGAAMVGLDWPYAAPRQRSALVAKSAQSGSADQLTKGRTGWRKAVTRCMAVCVRKAEMGCRHTATKAIRAGRPVPSRPRGTYH